MSGIDNLLENNQVWSRQMTHDRPDYFKKLAAQQSPDYLWIGCSDSRVPANEVVGLLPGELFVHRNVANLVHSSDINCLSVVEFAVEVLRVKHIIICGHYGCGGVKAALYRESHGLIDNWLIKIKETYLRNRAQIDALKNDEEKVDRLCELNVAEQVQALTRTTIVQNAWNTGQGLVLHGWIYGLRDGLIKDLGVRIDGMDQVAPAFRFSNG